MRNILILFLSGFAGLAGWESPASAGLFSSTGPVIAIFADDLFLGEAIGNIDGSGTISINSRTKPEVSCRGQFTSSAKLGGKGSLECSDNTSATIEFKRLSMRRGFGTGSSSRGSMTFTYGLTAIESEPYLKPPSGKVLRQVGKDLVLENEIQQTPVVPSENVSISPAQQVASDVPPTMPH